MYADLDHLFPILNSGADTESFHGVAVYNVEHNVDMDFTNYVPFITIIYRLFGLDDGRAVSQFINVLFGTGVLLNIRSALGLLKIPYKIQKTSMWIAVLMPNMIIFSGILLREAWVEYFISLSIIFFIRWYKKIGSALFNVFISIASVFIASYMHAGVIGVLIGYFAAFILLKSKDGEVKFTFTSIFMIGIVTVGVMFFLENLETFGGKFSNVDTDNLDALTQHSQAGGSLYLAGLQNSSFAMEMVTLPIRMIYFLYSPIPFDWRGVNDLFAFFIDSIVYLYFSYKIFKSLKGSHNLSDKNLLIFLVISIIVATAIFGMGTSTAGTAMRHRAKLLSLFVIAYAISQKRLIRHKVSG